MEIILNQKATKEKLFEKKNYYKIHISNSYQIRKRIREKLFGDLKRVEINIVFFVLFLCSCIFN